MSYDVIIVGSGPAGTLAATRLRNRRVLMLDVGFEPARQDSGADLDRNLFELKKTGKPLFSSLIGERFESLHNVDKSYLSPKLKAPLVRYVTRNWRRLSPVITENFEPVMSFARGGLANAWGAGVYPFTEEELSGFPVGLSDLQPYYRRIAELVGISGAADDLVRFFGDASNLLPPVELNSMGSDLLQRYQRRREYFHRREVYLGRPRIALLTRDHRGRKPYSYDGLEFFRPHIPAIYNPAFTLAEMLEERSVEYRPRHLVVRYEELDGEVRVYARNLDSGTTEVVRAGKVILAAGSLNTSKIVLQSASDHRTELSLLDNQISYLPLLNIRRIGSPVEKRSLPLQLNLVYRGDLYDQPIQGSIYGMTATLWTDFLFDFPLSARGAMSALRYLLPAMTIVQLFYPDEQHPGNHLRLASSGELVLRYRPRRYGELERFLIRVFRRIGYLGHPALCKFPMPGNSLHFAGLLPMRAEPDRPYQTDPDGLLFGSRRVHVADSACFPTLPSKNLTLTIMANAMRIADRVGESLDGNGARSREASHDRRVGAKKNPR